MAGVRPIRNGGRAIAVGASIAVHLVLLIAFLSGRDTAPVPEPARFDAEIVSLPPRERARSPRLARTAIDDRPHRPRVRPTAPQSGADVAAATPADQGADYAALRRALRGRVGCDQADLLDLTAEERRRCQDRRATALASMDGGPARRFDLSKRGAFQGRDETPYLARKPRNGCKVMTGGQTSAMGQEAGVVGIGCAVSF